MFWINKLVHSLKLFSVTVGIVVSAFFLQSGKVKGKIVCFGDSITFGALVEGNGWPEQLANLSDEIIVVNKGRKGRKTTDLKELRPVIESNKDADYFLFLLGVNDLKDGNDSLVALCVDNMKLMIEDVKKEIPQARIFLISPCAINLNTMTELNRNKKYNQNTLSSLIKLDQKYLQLAEEESTRFISLLNIVSSNNFLDGIHPNSDGYAQITQKIWSELNN